MQQFSPVQAKPIRFRGRSFFAFALTPEPKQSEWLNGLDRWIHNSPGFFHDRPVVLDLTNLKVGEPEIAGMVDALAQRGVRVLAVEGPEKLSGELPPVLRDARTVVFDTVPNKPAAADKPEAAPAEPVASRSLILDAPVRSGQSVVHPDGDVIVMGSIGSGADVVAAGSIHVYGTLRGRALAGAMGNPNARIFCRRNEAELVAIDGCYRTADSMDPGTRGRAAQCRLDDGVLIITALD